MRCKKCGCDMTAVSPGGLAPFFGVRDVFACRCGALAYVMPVVDREDLVVHPWEIPPGMPYEEHIRRLLSRRKKV